MSESESEEYIGRGAIRTCRPGEFPNFLTDSQNRAKQCEVETKERKSRKRKQNRDSISASPEPRKTTLLSRRLHYGENGEEIEQILTLDENWKRMEELDKTEKTNLKEETCNLEAREFVDTKEDTDRLIGVDSEIRVGCSFNLN